MPLFNFSDLAMLWPFANEADKTLFVYKQHEDPLSVDNRERLPNNERAILVLTGALGRIVMDDSSPDIRMVGPPGDRQPLTDTSGMHQGKHVIYVGGPGTSIGVSNFFSKCQEQEFTQTVHFPEPGEPAAVLRIQEDGDEPRYEFKATYHDRRKTQVKVDYGLALLTFNPADTAYKALLVAGLYGPGTLAAAEAISGPELSRDFIQPIIANFHLPPHLLGTVEVVVETKVDKEGELVKNEKNQPHVALRYIAVNGLELFPSPDLGKLRIAYPTWPCSESQVLHVARLRRPHDVEIRFEQIRGRTATDCRSYDSAFGASGSPSREPGPDFFRRFRDRDVIVISPHSDDSVIGCGGLVYYLRNRELWARNRQEEHRPNVHLLVMTSSSRGVSDREFGKYCDAVGIGPQRPPRHSSLHAQLRSQIRRNEALGEAFLLDAETHWMDLAVDEPENVSALAGKLKEVRKADKEGRRFTVLIPPFADEHPTHRWVRELVLRVLSLEEEYRTSDLCDVWVYESPWASLSPGNIDIILPLDKHAIFAKCQAIAMHQSQEVRTRYSEVARSQARRQAEVLPEEVFAFGGEAHGWDFVEVFQDLTWQKTIYEARATAPRRKGRGKKS